MVVALRQRLAVARTLHRGLDGRDRAFGIQSATAAGPPGRGPAAAAGAGCLFWKVSIRNSAWSRPAAVDSSCMNDCTQKAAVFEPGARHGPQGMWNGLERLGQAVVGRVLGRELARRRPAAAVHRALAAARRLVGERDGLARPGHELALLVEAGLELVEATRAIEVVRPCRLRASTSASPECRRPASRWPRPRRRYSCIRRRPKPPPTRIWCSVARSAGTPTTLAAVVRAPSGICTEPQISSLSPAGSFWYQAVVFCGSRLACEMKPKV